jgi:hypothetical protein
MGFLLVRTSESDENQGSNKKGQPRIINLLGKEEFNL